MTVSSRKTRAFFPADPGVGQVGRHLPDAPGKWHEAVVPHFKIFCQREAQVISHLQAQLNDGLTAINQYFLHCRMYQHQGLEKLAKKRLRWATS